MLSEAEERCRSAENALRQTTFDLDGASKTIRMHEEEKGELHRKLHELENRVKAAEDVMRCQQQDINTAEASAVREAENINIIRNVLGQQLLQTAHLVKECQQDLSQGPAGATNISYVNASSPTKQLSGEASMTLLRGMEQAGDDNTHAFACFDGPLPM